MRNINQIYEEVKSLPASALQSAIQNPSGDIPEWMALSEIKNRESLGSGSRKSPMTVRDQMAMGFPSPPPQLPAMNDQFAGVPAAPAQP